MHRRHFLAGLAATATCSALPRAARGVARDRHIVVVGAGIVGAAVAFRLAERGARVTVVDRSGPAAGATSRSFAWLNADFSKRPRHYHMLNRLGISGYRRLAQELPGLPVQWGGALQWLGDEGAALALREQVRELQQWGYPVRLLTAGEFRALEGGIRTGPLAAATYAEQEGFADPAATTRRLLEGAIAAGARLLAPCEVTALDLRAGRVTTVQTTTGALVVDNVVVAAGVGAPVVAALAGVHVPLVPAPGILVQTQAMPPLVSRVAIGPAAHVKQYRDGRVVVGDDRGPPTTLPHDYLKTSPDDFPDAATRELHARRLLAEASQYLPALAHAPIERVTLGWRPMPSDGYPIVGAAVECPNLYVAVTHSGVTLAPVLAELAAIEILDGVEVDEFAPYRLTRFSVS